MRNPYQVLGVSPLSGPDEIKAAFRQLAKTYHPDTGRTDARTRERFHEITAAYELLRRKESPPKPGKSETKADKKPDVEPEIRPRPKPEPAQETKRSEHKSPDPEEEPRKQPAFADFLDQLKSAGRRAFGHSGLDHTYDLNIPFSDAVKGTKRRLILQNGKPLDVHVPPGVEDGQQIRLRGQGASGLTSRDAGDAFVTIAIAPHPIFRREGADIHIDTAVSLPEAVLGSKIYVPTVDGEVAVTVPAGSNSGTVLRLKGKGLPYPPGKRRLGRGDQYVNLTLILPDKIDDQLKDFAAMWAPGLQHRPRKD